MGAVACSAIARHWPLWAIAGAELRLRRIHSPLMAALTHLITLTRAREARRPSRRRRRNFFLLNRLAAPAGARGSDDGPTGAAPTGLRRWAGGVAAIDRTIAA